jgi:hypothetical protein
MNYLKLLWRSFVVASRIIAQTAISIWKDAVSTLMLRLKRIKVVTRIFDGLKKCQND